MEKPDKKTIIAAATMSAIAAGELPPKEAQAASTDSDTIAAEKELTGGETDIAELIARAKAGESVEIEPPVVSEGDKNIARAIFSSYESYIKDIVERHKGDSWEKVQQAITDYFENARQPGAHEQLDDISDGTIAALASMSKSYYDYSEDAEIDKVTVDSSTTPPEATGPGPDFEPIPAGPEIRDDAELVSLFAPEGSPLADALQRATGPKDIPDDLRGEFMNLLRAIVNNDRDNELYMPASDLHAVLADTTNRGTNATIGPAWHAFKEAVEPFLK